MLLRRRSGLVLAVIVLFCAGLFLARFSLTGMAVRQFCRAHELTCELKVRDVSFSGGEASQVRILAGGRELASAESIVFGLSWASPVSAKLSQVRIMAPAILVDLTESAPFHGVISGFRSGGAAGTAWPHVTASEAQVILRTDAGDVLVRGEVEAGADGVVSARFSADPANLELDAYRLDMDQLRGDIRVTPQSVEGDVALRLKTYVGAGVQCDDIDISVSVNHFAGPAYLAADLHAGKIASDGRAANNLAMAVKAVVDVSPFELAPEKFSAENMLSALRRMEARVSVERSEFDGVGWSGAQADVLVEEGADIGALLGNSRLTLRDVTSAYGAAGSMRHVSQIHASPSQTEGVLNLESVGELRILGGQVGAILLEDITGVIDSMFPGPLKANGRQLSADLARAAQDMDVEAPVVIGMRGMKGVDVRVEGPLEVRGDGQILMRLRPGRDAPSLRYGSEGRSINLSGNLELHAGKASLMADGLNVRRQSGAWTGVAGLELDMGRTEGSALAGHVEHAIIKHDLKGTQVSLRGAELTFNGPAYGARWKGLMLSGDVSGDWGDGTWRVRGADAIDIDVGGAEIGGLLIGPFRTQISGLEPVAQRDAQGMHGALQIAPLSFAVATSTRTVDVSTDAIGLTWRKAKAFKFDAVVPDIGVDFDVAGKSMHFQAPNVAISGEADRILRVRASVENGMGDLGYFGLEKVAGHFLLGFSGRGLTLEGHGVSARLRDRISPARFVAMDYVGELETTEGRFSGKGVLTHPFYGDRLADLTLFHEMESGVGRMVLEPTSLTFDPRGLQPAAIAPGMRGIAANVSGKVTLTGNAQWGGVDGFQTRAALELADVGFVTAKAGLFEGVSGVLELTDVLSLKSPPAQAFAIRYWNPGVPLENGELAFRLTGGGDVLLELARWPFADGEIVSEPMQWSTEAPSNTVVVTARDLDLSRLVSDLGVPDIEASGRLSGRFPVEFATGAARVRDAVLKAEAPGGVIRYDASGLGNAQGRDANVNLLIQAVKDFHYTLLQMGVDGDVGGEMTLHLSLLGHNPAVLEGYPFDLEVTVTADLMNLLNSKSAGEREIEAIVSAITDARR